MADNKASFLWAIKQQESGGDYNSVNSSSGALGAYQVMPENVPSWTRQALGRSLTPQQFLSDPSAQDAVADAVLGGYYDQYGSRGAAAMWYSGQPDPNKTFGTPSVADYVNQVVSRMSSNSPVSGSTGVENANTWNDLTNPGGTLAKGLETGLVAAFKAVMGPTLSWMLWIFESGLGVVLMGFGAMMLFKQTPVYEALEKKAEEAVSIAAPEVAVAKKAATKPKPKPKPKPVPETTVSNE